MVDRRQKCLERFGQIVPSSIYQLPSTTGMSTKTVAIVGASGYSGEELVRLLLSHPQAEVIFLALPHGVAAEFAAPLLHLGCRIIDLSADFRLKSPAVYQEFYAHEHPAPDLLARAVYGLPEVYRAEIQRASLVASPGCYPTSILLPAVPLLKAGL